MARYRARRCRGGRRAGPDRPSSRTAAGRPAGSDPRGPHTAPIGRALPRRRGRDLLIRLAARGVRWPRGAPTAVGVAGRGELAPGAVEEVDHLVRGWCRRRRRPGGRRRSPPRSCSGRGRARRDSIQDAPVTAPPLVLRENDHREAIAARTAILSAALCAIPGDVHAQVDLLQSKVPMSTKPTDSLDAVVRRAIAAIAESPSVALRAAVRARQSGCGDGGLAR